jgi:hypothetical protein
MAVGERHRIFAPPWTVMPSVLSKLREKIDGLRRANARRAAESLGIREGFLCVRTSRFPERATGDDMPRFSGYPSGSSLKASMGACAALCRAMACTIGMRDRLVQRTLHCLDRRLQGLRQHIQKLLRPFEVTLVDRSAEQFHIGRGLFSSVA